MPLLPRMYTLTPDRGCRVTASLTVPVIVIVCANPGRLKCNNNTAEVKSLILFMSKIALLLSSIFLLTLEKTKYFRCRSALHDADLENSRRTSPNDDYHKPDFETA